MQAKKQPGRNSSNAGDVHTAPLEPGGCSTTVGQWEGEGAGERVGGCKEESLGGREKLEGEELRKMVEVDLAVFGVGGRLLLG